MTNDFLPSGRVVLDASDISRALTRLAHEIVERTHGATNLTLMGIPTRGATLAHRLGEKISQIQGSPVPVGAIDITMSYAFDLLAPSNQPRFHLKVSRVAWSF